MNRLSTFVLLCLALLGLVPCLVQAAVFPVTQCAGTRFGSDLGCTANDVQITGMTVSSGPATCTGGGSVTLDLSLTVNFGSPNRWDIGIFISNDGKDPQLTVANGGATSCSVAVLPNTAPFLNLDSNGGTDTCGDGNSTINGGTGSGVLNMTNVTVPCQSLSASGQLYIPFVVSWDNQASPTGAICTSNANPVPNTKSKCNAPTVAQGSVSVVVLPSITKSDGVSVVTPGVPTTYAITITNSTGVTLSSGTGNAAVFKDPAVSNLSVSGVSCAASGGASCPASSTVAGMQGAGLTIPSLPNGGSVTFSVTASVNGGTAAGTVITNTASVTANGQSNTASDSNTVVYPSPVHLKTVSLVSDPVNGTTNPKFIPGAVADYTLRITNTGQGTIGNNTIVITDPIPPNTELFTGNLSGGAPFIFIDGIPASGLACSFLALNNLTDCVDFSNDGGTSWSFVPNGGYDPAVSNVRFKPSGTMNANTGSGSPYFDLRFRVRVK
jgi:hypothetical protein